MINDELLNKFARIKDLPVSEEMLGAYIEDKLPATDIHKIDELIANNELEPLINDIKTSDLKIDNDEIPLNLDNIKLPIYYDGVFIEDDLLSIKNNTNMATYKTYGYESNNEIDTFDPNIWQGNQPTCAIRSQEIILRDYGIFHTQEELVEFAKKNGWFDPDPKNGGTDKYAVGNILDACGIPTTRTDNATIYDIISELRAGHRVIVSVDADELWVKKEPNLFKRVIAQVNNKANDTIQGFLGIEGANHALVVAGVNVNPKDPSDIKVTLIDSGTGDVCVEYSFKDFHAAWSDGHCRMISTDIPAPFQYNYITRQIEPSNIATEYSPAMATMPEGLTNQFHLTQNYFDEYKSYSPLYDNLDDYIVSEGVDLSDVALNPNTGNLEIVDNVQTDYNPIGEDVGQTEDLTGNDILEMDTLQDSGATNDDNSEVVEDGYGVDSNEKEEESEEI